MSGSSTCRPSPARRMGPVRASCAASRRRSVRRRISTSCGAGSSAPKSYCGHRPLRHRREPRSRLPKPRLVVLLVPGLPMMDEESAEQVKALVAKGALGAGAFETDDCRATYDELSARGVTFLSEPTERFYGIEATFRDNSGNWFSMTQHTDAAQDR